MQVLHIQMRFYSLISRRNKKIKCIVHRGLFKDPGNESSLLPVLEKARRVRVKNYGHYGITDYTVKVLELRSWHKITNAIKQSTVPDVCEYLSVH